MLDDTFMWFGRSRRRAIDSVIPRAAFASCRRRLATSQTKRRVIFATMLAFAVASSGLSDALRMINLDAPQTVRQGDTIQLRCAYNLANVVGLARRYARRANATTGGQHDKPAQQDPHFERLISPSASQHRPRHQEPSQDWISIEPKKLATNPTEPAESKDEKQREPDESRSRRQLEFDRPDGPTFATDRGANSLESLYAVKWYKDGREFFRFLAQDWPHKQVLPLEGLHIDGGNCATRAVFAIRESNQRWLTVLLKNQLDKSDNQTVTLRNVSLATSGLFKCEVSTDAPFFVTKSIERNLLVYYLPNEGPIIESKLTPALGGQLMRQLALGDQAEFHCTTHESKPAARIDWIINQTLNLSSLVPLNGLGSPIFQLSHKKLVRVPSQVKSLDSGPMRPRPLRSNKSIPDGNPIQVPTLQQSKPATYSTHELKTRNTTRAEHLAIRPVLDEFSSSLVAPNEHELADSSLDQVLEISSSALNFIVNLDLLQLLAKLENGASNNGKQTVSPRSRLTQTIRGQAVTSNGTRGIASSSIMWKKSLRLGTRPISGGNQTIQRQAAGSHLRAHMNIKCVARLLHLTMSDEIKLQLVDRTSGPSLTNEMIKAANIGRDSDNGDRNLGTPHHTTPTKYFALVLLSFSCLLSYQLMISILLSHLNTNSAIL